MKTTSFNPACTVMEVKMQQCTKGIADLYPDK